MDKLKTGKNQDELEMDQLAYAELNRLQRQVKYLIYTTSNIRSIVNPLKVW